MTNAVTKVYELECATQFFGSTVILVILIFIYVLYHTTITMYLTAKSAKESLRSQGFFLRT